MTRKEKINRSIGLTFDLLNQIVDKPSLTDKIPNGSIIEFIEKDFSTTKKTADQPQRKFLKVTSQIEGI
jgi:hypothetical protein